VDFFTQTYSVPCRGYGRPSPPVSLHLCAANASALLNEAQDE
jgi:hypothetical protein